MRSNADSGRLRAFLSPGGRLRVAGPVAAILVATLGASSHPVTTAATASGTTGSSGYAYTPVSPTRICDTRPKAESGLTDECTGKTLAAGASLTVTMPSEVPTTAVAVVINVTATNTVASGFLAVYPAGQSLPATSNLNFAAGQTVANLVTVGLGASAGTAAISIEDGPATGGASDVVVDLEGYYGPASPSSVVGQFHPVAPARIADTRCGGPTPASFCPTEQLPSVNSSLATLGPRSSITVQVAGQGGVPVSGVEAVALDVAVTDTTAPSFVSVYPSGMLSSGTAPGFSNQNWVGGATLPATVIVALGPLGQVSIFNHSGLLDVAVDVEGYFSSTTGTAGELFVPAGPNRMLDTRTTAPLAGGHFTSLQVAGAAGVPAMSTGAVLDVVDVQPVSGNFLTVFPAGSPRAVTSSVNWVPADPYDVVPNAVYASLGSTGAISIYNGPPNTGLTNVIVDLYGYFVGGTSPTPSPPPTAAPINAISSSPVTGNFYSAPTTAQSFVAKPGATPAFSQTFPTVDFNPPAGTVTGEPADGPGPTTRPFTDAVTDSAGDFLGTVPAEGAGQQAGLGGLSAFDAVLLGSLAVAQPRRVTFLLAADDGFLLGVGGRATRVNGPDVVPSGVTATPFKGYSLVAANDSCEAPGAGVASYSFTISFPASGSYPYELDYFSCAGQQLSLAFGVGTVSSTTTPADVFVGYADSLRPPSSLFSFPNPWVGAAGVIFQGCTNCTYDDGAIRIDNATNGPLTVNNVAVAIGPTNYTAASVGWTFPVTIPVGDTLILTGGNFDTSDQNGVYNCTPDGYLPKVIVTLGTITTTYTDTGQVLNTKGFDLAGCPSGTNESQGWQSVSGGGGTAINEPLPPQATLTLGSASPASNLVGQTRTLTVTALDPAGQPDPKLPVTVRVDGANPGTLTGTTGSTGIATLSYVGINPGTDTIYATAFPSGVAAVSNQLTLTWAYGSSSSSTAPPPTITNLSPVDGSVVTSPVPITATISPPSSESVTKWSVTYQELARGPLVTLASGTGPPPSPLTTFDPTSLPNGTYAISVSSTASEGGTQSVAVTVAVHGNLKLGRYVTTYQDLSIPVNGFQMAIDRIYDSTDKQVGTFGVGWQLSVSDFHVTANGPLGAGGWTEYPTQCSLGLCFYAYKSSKPHYVTVTSPSGRQQVFDFTPQGGAGVLYFQGTTAFTGRPGTDTTSTLQVLGDTSAEYKFDGNLYNESGQIIDPTEYLLTTSNGDKLVLSTQTGLVSETDLNGNSMTVDSSGIHSSSGQSISFVRDSLGRVTQIIAPGGQIFSYTYDAAGDLTTVNYPTGGSDTYTYDTNHDLLSAVGPGRPLFKQTYNSAGRLTSITDANGDTVSVSSNVGALQQVFTGPGGSPIVVDSYDSAGDLISQQETANNQSRTFTYTYDENGRMLSVTNPLGATTHLTYDAAGNVTSVTDPNGNTTVATYGQFSNLTSITNPNGTTSSLSYDGSGNLTGVALPGGATMGFTYNSTGDPIAITDPLGRTTKVTWTSGGLPASVTDPAGDTTTYTYDANGNLASVTDPAGDTTTYTYDAVGRQTSVTDPLGDTTKTSYNSLGLVASTTDANGNSTSFSYDPAGQLTQITDALGGTVGLGYNPEGELSSVTGPGGRERTFSYDGFGDELSTTAPGEGTTTYTYDALGQPISETNALGITVTAAYDAAGNLIAQDSASGGVQYGYDALDRLVSVTDATGTTAISYGPQGQVTSVDSPEGNLSYTYDAALQRTSMSVPGLGTIHYAYNQNGQVTTVTDPQGRSISLTYTANGQLSTVDSPGSVTTSYTYDAAGRVASIRSVGPGGTLEAESYTRNAVGNPTAVTTTAGAGAFGYDALNRLVSASYPGGGSQAFTYDPSGNLTSVTTNGTQVPYAYSSNGLLSAVGTQVVSYNAAGDLTGLGNEHFSWNSFGQLSSVTTGGQTTSLSYNGLGLQVGATSPAGTTTTLWDLAQGPLGGLGGLPLPASSGGVAYLGAGGRILGQVGLTSPNPATYFLADALGSVLGQVNQSGALVSSTSYAAFGAQLSSGTPSAVGFTGQLAGPDGLLYLRSRQYDPTLGQFLSPDPVQPNGSSTGGFNRYSYALNDPSRLVDPSGRDAVETAVLDDTTVYTQLSEMSQIGQTLACIDGAVAESFSTAFSAALAAGPYTASGNYSAVARQALSSSLEGCAKSAVISAVSDVPILGSVGGSVASNVLSCPTIVFTNPVQVIAQGGASGLLAHISPALSLDNTVIQSGLSDAASYGASPASGPLGYFDGSPQCP